MNILTVQEDDDTTTRMNVSCDNKATHMAAFFRIVCGLNVMVEPNVKVINTDEAETGRAIRYVTEWRKFKSA